MKIKRLDIIIPLWAIAGGVNDGLTMVICWYIAMFLGFVALFQLLPLRLKR